MLFVNTARDGHDVFLFGFLPLSIPHPHPTPTPFFIHIFLLMFSLVLPTVASKAERRGEERRGERREERGERRESKRIPSTTGRVAHRSPTQNKTSSLARSWLRPRQACHWLQYWLVCATHMNLKQMTCSYWFKTEPFFSVSSFLRWLKAAIYYLTLFCPKNKSRR